LVVDFGSPVFELLYLKDFAGRLEMATAEAYLSAPHRVLALKCRVHGSEPVSPRVTLERWGSRNLKHWYMNVNHDSALGLDGTTTSIQRGRSRAAGGR
jgi:hypothetical protein